jgi:hypothetical protein
VTAVCCLPGCAAHTAAAGTTMPCSCLLLQAAADGASSHACCRQAVPKQPDYPPGVEPFLHGPITEGAETTPFNVHQPCTTCMLPAAVLQLMTSEVSQLEQLLPQVAYGNIMAENPTALTPAHFRQLMLLGQACLDYLHAICCATSKVLVSLASALEQCILAPGCGRALQRPKTRCMHCNWVLSCLHCRPSQYSCWLFAISQQHKQNRAGTANPWPSQGVYLPVQHLCDHAVTAAGPASAAPGGSQWPHPRAHHSL